MKKLFLLFFFVSTIGYSQTQVAKSEEQVSWLERQWSNFVSYFNGYYNATRLYDLAMNKLYLESLRDGDEISTVFPVVKQRSTIYSDMGKVINKLSVIIQFHPNSDLADDGLFLMGKAYYFIGEYPSAERKFKEIFSNYPTSDVVFESTLFLARSYFGQSRNEEASDILAGLLNRSDVPAVVKGEANLILGERYYSASQFENAKEYLVNGINLYEDPEGKARAAYLLGNILIRQYNYEEAILNYQLAKKVSELPALWYWAAVRQIQCYTLKKDFQTADQFVKELFNDEDLISYFYELEFERIKLELVKGNRELAIQEFKQYIRENPSSKKIPYSFFYLAEIEDNSIDGSKELARYFYTKSMSGMPVTDTLSTFAKSRQATLTKYLNLRYEYSELFRKLTIQEEVPKDPKEDIDSSEFTARINTEDLSDENIVVEQPKPRTTGTKGKAPTTQNPRTMSTQMGGSGRNMDGEGLTTGGSGGTSQQTRGVSVDPFDSTTVVNSYLKSAYKEKYSIATDSTILLKNKNAFATVLEKLIDYFYFDERLPDSIIFYANSYENIFPKSDRLPRILYAKSAAFGIKGEEKRSEQVLEDLYAKFPLTIYGKEAALRLKIPDPETIKFNNEKTQYELAVSYLLNDQAAESKKILMNLKSSIDSTHQLYPNVLYSLGYISEFSDKNWEQAFSYYQMVRNRFKQSVLAKELEKMISFQTQPTVASTVSSGEVVKQNSNTIDDATTDGRATDRNQLTLQPIRFVVSNNLAPRFKRQPKLNTITW